MNNLPEPCIPGSPYAIAHGCLCPVIDNGRGAGCRGTKEKPEFIMIRECPLHGSSPNAADAVELPLEQNFD